ncbi:MAG: MFS transporter [Syntrophaceae bacterium]|nr:MFS transporter [Syntrophaceae bacterium]
MKQLRTKRWLNRNVFGFGLTSLLSDFCHEMATAVLPQFMQVIGSSAAALGFIEGVADALSSFTKLGTGYHSDKIGHRKGWTVLGYLLTAFAKAIFAFAVAWPLILIGRVIGWLGRGIRGPLRDAMLAESVSPEDRGKAFGFHRASDTMGAILGPLAAYGILTLIAKNPHIAEYFGYWFPSFADEPGGAYRIIFLMTLIPGLLSVVSLAYLVKERRRTTNHVLRFWQTIKSMPKSYRSFLLAVGLFGLADFAPTLMILRASTTLTPVMGLIEASRLAALLYIIRNITYAIASFPIGAHSNKFPRNRYLAFGYGIAVVTFLGFAFVMPSFAWFVVLFILSGLFIAWEDTIEGVAVRDYVNDDIAGTAYGVLGVVNGIGDFASSIIVGLLWTSIGASWGFLYAAVVGLAGTIFMMRAPNPVNRA